jgi:hypothetical protein
MAVELCPVFAAQCEESSYFQTFLSNYGACAYIQHQHDGVFLIRLAGRNIVMLTDVKLCQSMTKVPEDILSYRNALDDTGFSLSLGPNHEGS